jgi:mRNA-degrading endonuclease RelE of RelBE toxin-antitoxin system
MKFSDQVCEALRNLHPGVRRDIRRGLDAANAGKPCDVKALQAPLEGCYRLRVGRHRVIFRYAKGELIAEYLAPRNIIYEVFTTPRELLDD